MVRHNGGLLRKGTRSQGVSSEKARERLRKEEEERKRRKRRGKAGEKRDSGPVLHGLFFRLFSLRFFSLSLPHNFAATLFRRHFQSDVMRRHFRRERYALRRFNTLMDNHNAQKSGERQRLFCLISPEDMYYVCNKYE